jgi:hypothetical protein
LGEKAGLHPVNISQVERGAKAGQSHLQAILAEGCVTEQTDQA